MNQNKKSWIVVTAVTLLFVLFIGVVLPKISAYSSDQIGVSEAPDTSFFYNSNDLYDIAKQYGEEGRITYIKLRWTFDLVWPLVYTAFLVAWLWKLSTYLMIKKYYYIPIVAMMFDYLENLGTTIVFLVYPNKLIVLATITPWLSLLKWSILGLSFIIWFVLLIMAVFKWFGSLRSVIRR